MAFDLAVLCNLAFKKGDLPDHPITDEAEARAMMASLPQGNAAKALAELMHWVVSINEHDGFTPVRRARVLMEIDVAAQPLWRPLGGDFLAPRGKPAEGRDGDL